MIMTRQNIGFQIYSDVVGHQHPTAMGERPPPQLQPSAMPLQPIRNPQGYPDVTIHPPMSTPQHLSPLKSQPISPSMAQYNAMNYVPIPAPAQVAMYAPSPVKKHQTQPLQHYQPMPGPPQAMFGTFDRNFETFQAHEASFPLPSSMPETNYVDFPDPSYPRRQPLKRSYSDAAPLNDRQVKRLRVDEDMTPLPNPEDMPVVEDDGHKPSFSYAQMIGMAILRAPNRRLTLAQIYDWISTSFAYYRSDPKQGWHNSIRHNLSLNKAFKKQERPKGDAGKGSYWIIEPGMEHQFLNHKMRKNNTIANVTMHQNGSQTSIQMMAPPLAEALAPKPWSIQPLSSAPAATIAAPPRPRTAPALPELSSDATLPASDPALNEDGANDDNAPVIPPPSSPAPVMNSSPPVAVGHHRTISSPVHFARPASSRQHKRSVTAMDDSGYYSEIPSSIRKPNNNGIVLPSDIDVQRTKLQTGRAEDEIRRLRSSSHDLTPSHRRFTAPAGELGQSSSPGQTSPELQNNPKTPRFKKPMEPPPSVSPNTQLNLHRQQMAEFQGSPMKDFGLFTDHALSFYSPQFKPPGSVYRSHFEEQFQIFEDPPFTPGLGSSPLKSMKRPSILRSNTSAAILGDVTNTTRLNAKTPIKTPSKQPVLKPAFKPGYTGSPLRRCMPAIADDNDAFFGLCDFGDENSEGEGLDIGKGFAKIGENGTSMNSRPGLARSFTTRF